MQHALDEEQLFLTMTSEEIIIYLKNKIRSLESEVVELRTRMQDNSSFYNFLKDKLT